MLVGVVGAGAMGSGIAQVAAAAGLRVVIGDANPGAVERGRATVANALARLVEKKKLDTTESKAIADRIGWLESPLADDLEAFRACGIVIEAVVEELTVKQELFGKLDDALAPDAILATNTSSLSVASIASACERPERVIGIHFFNPAPVMPLVEVIPWLASSTAVITRATQLIEGWRKSVVLATDTPGFIVNRVARPFYGEALRIHDERIADVATIDWAMREIGGFRMGPFELMDFIGNDVNYAVTRSVFEAFFNDPRYKPSLTQRRLVEAGFLGRKTGRGYYDYASGVTPPQPMRDHALGRRVVDRVLAMLVNEAIDAVYFGVASPADVDRAMTLGVNYPRGLLAWGNDIGLPVVLERLEALQDDYAEDRYRPSPLLKQMVRDQRRFFE
jgi:3-hydroxybutyryl-CoA dehydrogenase